MRMAGDFFLYKGPTPKSSDHELSISLWLSGFTKLLIKKKKKRKKNEKTKIETKTATRLAAGFFRISPFFGSFKFLMVKFCVKS